MSISPQRVCNSVNAGNESFESNILLCIDQIIPAQQTEIQFSIENRPISGGGFFYDPVVEIRIDGEQRIRESFTLSTSERIDISRSVTTSPGSHIAEVAIVRGQNTDISPGDDVSVSQEFIVGTAYSVFQTSSGPFPPGTTQTLATVQVINNGASGQVFHDWAELNSDGSVKRMICSVSTTLDSGQTGIPSGGGSRACSFVAGNQAGNLDATLVDRSGATQFFGARVWGENETRPPFPSAESNTIAVNV